MLLRIKVDEIQVCNSNPQVGIYYAIPLKPTLAQITEAAGTVGLTYEDLGKLAAIVSSSSKLKAPDILQRAENIGVEAVLKLR